MQQLFFSIITAFGWKGLKIKTILKTTAAFQYLQSGTISLMLQGQFSKHC